MIRHLPECDHYRQVWPKQCICRELRSCAQRVLEDHRACGQKMKERAYRWDSEQPRNDNWLWDEMWRAWDCAVESERERIGQAVEELMDEANPGTEEYDGLSNLLFLLREGTK